VDQDEREGGTVLIKSNCKGLERGESEAGYLNDIAVSLSTADNCTTDKSGEKDLKEGQKKKARGGGGGEEKVVMYLEGRL